MRCLRIGRQDSTGTTARSFQPSHKASLQGGSNIVSHWIWQAGRFLHKHFYNSIFQMDPVCHLLKSLCIFSTLKEESIQSILSFFNKCLLNNYLFLISSIFFPFFKFWESSVDVYLSAALIHWISLTCWVLGALNDYSNLIQVGFLFSFFFFHIHLSKVEKAFPYFEWI